MQTALGEVTARQLRGHEVTPFLLARMRELTGGKSLETNIRLVKNNAAIGARIAAALVS